MFVTPPLKNQLRHKNIQRELNALTHPYHTVRARIHHLLMKRATHKVRILGHKIHATLLGANVELWSRNASWGISVGMQPMSNTSTLPLNGHNPAIARSSEVFPTPLLPTINKPDSPTSNSRSAQHLSHPTAVRHFHHAPSATSSPPGVDTDNPDTLMRSCTISSRSGDRPVPLRTPGNDVSVCPSGIPRLDSSRRDSEAMTLMASSSEAIRPVSPAMLVHSAESASRFVKALIR